MNKLVSRNSILRFKEGLKIVKVLLGIDSKLLLEVGRDNWGSPLYFNPKDNKLYSKSWFGGYSYEGDSYKYLNLLAGKSGIIRASDYIKKLPLTNKSRIKRTPTGKTSINKNEEIAILKLLNPKSAKSYFYRQFTNRANEIGGVNNIKAWLRKLGVKADGIWGRNTENAYNTYILQLLSLLNIPSGLNIIPQIDRQTPYDIISANRNQPTLNKQGSQLVSRNPVERFKSMQIKNR